MYIVRFEVCALQSVQTNNTADISQHKNTHYTTQTIFWCVDKLPNIEGAESKASKTELWLKRSVANQEVVGLTEHSISGETVAHRQAVTKIIWRVCARATQEQNPPSMWSQSLNACVASSETLHDHFKHLYVCGFQHRCKRVHVYNGLHPGSAFYINFEIAL